jgi:pyruvate kinase
VRKTKIIATIGPASKSSEIIKKLIEAGVNVFRLNFSHGDHGFHQENITTIRKVSAELNKIVAILQDLSGPKIRIGEIREPFVLHQGEILEFYKIPIYAKKENGVGKIYLEHPEILEDLKVGDFIFIADGLIRVRVIERKKEKVVGEVIIGGVISSRKGVNFPGARLSIPAMTEKDKKDLAFGIKHGVDIIALSFVKNKKDVLDCKSFLKELGGNQPVFAKIETQEAVENIDEILETADGLMIARGDLGVELPIQKVPIIQKLIVNKAKELGKPVIIATQMLTSMINSVTPSRADVSDIANAVLDGADALMLSDETAVGNYPVEAVRVMHETILEAEKVYPYLTEEPKKVSADFAIAYSSCILAEELGAKTIVVFTKSGSSALRVAKFRPEANILACVHDEEVLRKLCVVWGVTPYLVLSKKNLEDMVKEFVKKALEDKIISEKDTLVLTMGYPVGKKGTTNLIRVLKREQILEIIRKN